MARSTDAGKPCRNWFHRGVRGRSEERMTDPSPDNHTAPADGRPFPSIPASGFSVSSDDNFHLYDESERGAHGRFPTYAEAVAECKRIVDASLRHEYKPGMTPAELYEAFCDFGDDPFVSPPPPVDVTPFSAWSYAKARAAEIVAEMNVRR